MQKILFRSILAVLLLMVAACGPEQQPEEETTQEAVGEVMVQQPPATPVQLEPEVATPTPSPTPEPESAIRRFAYEDWTAWQPKMDNATVFYTPDGVSPTSDTLLLIDVPTSSTSETWYQYKMILDGVKAGEMYELTTLARTEDVTGGVGASMCVGIWDDEVGRVTFSESERLRDDKDWVLLRGAIFVPPGYDQLLLQLTLNGTGRVWYDQVRLRKLTRKKSVAQSGEIGVKVTNKVTTRDFLGFGVEDDLYFYTDATLRHGVTEADIEERNKRIQDLDPKVIATIFWWDAICPSHNLDEISYESQFMEALYKTLEPHQRAQRQVFFGDVFWGWKPEEFPYSEENVEQGVEIYLDLIEHLIKEKGFSCIRHVCISGEVDMVFEKLGGTFESYLKATRLLREGLNERGLEQVNVIGDKSGGLVWFRKAAKANQDVFDIYTVHEYPDYRQYPLIDYRYEKALEAIADNTDPIGKDSEGNPVHSPVFSYEIGYGDTSNVEMSTLGRRMPTYEYGLLCANTAISALNRGIVGGSVWCLHSMYYTEGAPLMDWGIWEFKDTNWRVRPIYYGYGLFSRYCGRGALPRKTVLSQNVYDLKAGCVEDEEGDRTFFAVNLSSASVTLNIEGMPKGEYTVYEYTQDRLPKMGDPLYGRLEALRTDKVWDSASGQYKMAPRSIVMLKKRLMTAEAFMAQPPEREGWNSWLRSAEEEKVQVGSSEVAVDEGGQSLMVEVPEDAPVGFWGYQLDLSGVEEGEIYEFSAQVKSENVVDGVGALTSIGLVHPDPANYDRLAAADSERIDGTADWTPVKAAVIVPPKVTELRLLLLLNGRGTVWFDDFELKRIETLPAAKPGPVDVQIQPGATTEEFLGFGLEDDAFFFLEENMEKGITPDDIAMREERIAQMDPPVIATIFWWDAFNPSRDLETITWNTELMEATYRTLEVHQAAGRHVFFGDVFWGWHKKQFPYSPENVEKGVDLYLKLLDHLIREKGFTCIKTVSISGEVDMVFEELGGTFDSYIQACKRLRKGLDARGLKDVRVVGDKSGGFVWFARAAKAAGDVFNVYTVHEYPDVTQYPIVDYRLRRALDVIHSYVDPVGRNATGEPVYNPAFVYEIGFRDQAAGDTDNTASAVHKFSYGLLCTNTALIAMNQGYTGGSVWCLHSMYYPGNNLMDFGFWEFKHKDWKIRPAYYGYGLLSRYTREGLKPLRCVTAPDYYNLTASALEDEEGNRRVFLVNLSDHQLEARIQGLAPGSYSVWEYREDRIPAMGDALYGEIDAMKTGEVYDPGSGPKVLPPHSLTLIQ